MTKLIMSTLVMLYLIIIADTTKIEIFELENFDDNKKIA